MFENAGILEQEGISTTSGALRVGSYGEAVWWTAMLLTTMGSDQFPRTTEGRIIAWLLAVYAFAIFGYITATVASVIFKVDQQQSLRTSQQSGSLTAMNLEVKELRQSIERMERLLITRDPARQTQNSLPGKR